MALHVPAQVRIFKCVCVHACGRGCSMSSLHTVLLYARYAEEIIEQAQSDQVEDEGDWKCLICEETNFSNFGACWSCGAQIKE